MLYWKKFLAKDNFLLAWKRLNTGTNFYYKKFFREVFLAYEISHETSIENLINRLKCNTFEPSNPDRIFIPKPSGLQRPITLLTVEDQLVWQALANILKIKHSKRRLNVEKKVVFSNLSSDNKIFFFENWKISYKYFREQISKIYKDRKWVAHFDLAAFFDTISHDHVTNLLNPRNPYSDMSVLIKKILKCWTSEKISGTISHGIPQGPIASSFIGELIFLDIDIEMMKYPYDFSYTRYVDDIRLFADNEDGVRFGVYLLEQLCRNKGLIPQSKKTSIFFAEDEETAFGKNFSLVSEERNYLLTPKFLDKIVDLKEKRISDITKFKYFLYNAQPTNKNLELLLYLFEKNPDLSDAFSVYFKRFYDNKTVIEHLIGLIKNKKFQYEYVEGNIWLTLAEIDPSRTNTRSLIPIAKTKILNIKTKLYLRYGLLVYLSKLELKFEKKIFNRFKYECSSIIQGLILPYISTTFKKSDYIEVLKIALIRSKPDAPLAATMCLIHDNIPFRGLKLSKKIKSPVRDTLVGLGLTSSQSLPKITPFQEIFKNRYLIDIDDWKPYLKKNYAHAHSILIISEKAYDMNPSSWLCNIDSFNDILTRIIINLDNSINQRTKDRSGKLVSYGILIEQNNPLDRKYPAITDILRVIHRRRCQIPEAHPHDIRTARKSIYLKTGERNNFLGKLKQLYSDINIIFKNI